MAIPPEPNLVLGPRVTAKVFLSQPAADFALRTSGARYFWFAYPPSELPDRILFREVRVRGRLRMSFAEMMLRFVSKDSGYQWHGFSHGAEINEVLHDIIPLDLASVLGFTATPLDSDPQGMIHEAWLEITYQPFDFAPVEEPPPPTNPIDGFPDGAIGTQLRVRATGGVAVTSDGLINAASIAWSHEGGSLWVTPVYLLGEATATTLDRYESVSGPWETRQELTTFEEGNFQPILGHPTSARAVTASVNGQHLGLVYVDSMTPIGGGQYLMAISTVVPGDSKFEAGYPPAIDGSRSALSLHFLDKTGMPTGKVLNLDEQVDVQRDPRIASNGSVVMIWASRPVAVDDAGSAVWQARCTLLDLDTGRLLGTWTKPGFHGGIAYVGGGKALIVTGGGNTGTDLALALVDARSGEEHARLATFEQNQLGNNGGGSFAYRRRSPSNPLSGGTLAVLLGGTIADYEVRFFDVEFGKPPLRQATRDDWLGGDADRPQEMPNHPTSTQQSIRQFGPPNTYA